MEPEESLATIERTIRKAIRLMLPDWRTSVGGRDLTLAGRAAVNEESNRRGVLSSGDTLDYLYTKPAFALVRDRWSEFEPMLLDRVRIDALLSFVEDVRNTVAPGRELVAFERDLVAGIAGYLDNLVALWETTSNGRAAHYPVITSLRDSFGREGLTASVRSHAAPIRVEVGQTVELRAQATESRGQGVLWVAGLVDYLQMLEARVRHWENHPTESPGLIRARGASVRFRYVFTDYDVGELKTLYIAILSRSKHHRHDAVDDFQTFQFAVNPPRDA